MHARDMIVFSTAASSPSPTALPTTPPPTAQPDHNAACYITIRRAASTQKVTLSATTSHILSLQVLPNWLPVPDHNTCLLAPRAHVMLQPLQWEHTALPPKCSMLQPRPSLLIRMLREVPSGTAYLEPALALLPRPRCPSIAVTPVIWTVVPDCVGTWTRMLEVTERDVRRV